MEYPPLHTLFIEESNRIEGIHVFNVHNERDAYGRFLELEEITVPALQEFVETIQPGTALRDQFGMDVRVGNHVPKRGGPDIPEYLQQILNLVNDGNLYLTPYEAHHMYEHLHPFNDCNGRSGRALWLWMMHREDVYPETFLHNWYYQSLQNNPLRN